MSSIWDWSKVAASNGTADSAVNWQEGQPPSTVNGSARQMMARNAELLGDIGGALTAGGSANVLTVMANSAFTAYTDGLILALRGATDNTAAATLNVNSISAKSIRKVTVSGDTALSGAEIQADGIYLLMYSSALNASAGGWQLLNPTMDFSSFVTKTGAETLTNKTLTAPVINGGTNAGATFTTATITTPTLTLKQSAAPTPTAEGDIQWDTDDNRLIIGDGAAQAVISRNPATTVDNTVPRFDGTKGATQTSGVTISDADLVEASGGFYVGSARVGGAPDAVFVDQKTAGTGGGTFTSGAWRTRDLNTKLLDPGSLVTVSANTFVSTVAGWVEWSAPAKGVQGNKTRLYNVTDSTVAGVGSTAWNDTSPDSGSISVGGCAVVAGKTYRLEHQSSSSRADGLGVASNFSEVEIYTQIKFWRT
ncbi:hypothetical protein [Mesorhizobium sp. M1136]|uniref:hypothetical protein n=1 Tax=Mesorhizobium sp. M1136 TaxID=2957059 RepID=UPI00333650EE